MTPVPSAPVRETLDGSMMQVFGAAREVARTVPELREQSRIRAAITVTVFSEAEVDGAAALMRVTPVRSGPWTYQAGWTEGAVTVTVAFTADPCGGPADASAIDAVRCMAAGEIRRDVA